MSWHGVTGIGQVVTLKLPAERRREVNLAIEPNPGRVRTEFYAICDFRPVRQGIRARR